MLTTVLLRVLRLYRVPVDAIDDEEAVMIAEDTFTQFQPVAEEVTVEGLVTGHEE